MIASPAKPTPELTPADTNAGPAFLRAFLAKVFTIVLESLRLSARLAAPVTALLAPALSIRRIAARANNPKKPPRWLTMDFAGCRLLLLLLTIFQYFFSTPLKGVGAAPKVTVSTIPLAKRFPNFSKPCTNDFQFPPRCPEPLKMAILLLPPL